ncbi:hypothetical protein [Actinomyces sp. MRS3W]|uniref:hypothetical protein n=1 Tax=Actinomyces sp. MRS3W TaxID=2800796 RepID=UPI0028FD8541|nr:hypothetical protein [Actinomyces sp. MRS3W]MDU0347864.1 hypothetical protein [Actinomyces sp. MRS3W]
MSEGSDGSVTVSVSVSAEFTSAAVDGSSSSGSGGATTSSQSVAVSVRPVCWYKQLRSGADTAEMIEDTSDPGLTESLGKTFDGYEQYADDADGYWYRPTCDYRYFQGTDPGEYDTFARQWLDGKTPVYVPAGQAAPEPEVDGETLARAAWDAVTIPAATIGYNPTVGESRATIVGMDTWIWATGDTPSQATVTATAGSTTATVTATASGLDLEPTDGEVFCTGFGIPWTEQNDRVGTDCVIVFDRSSAHLEGSVTPVEVGVDYAASFTATDGATGYLGTHTTEATTTIPVAEIQVLNTRPTKQP